MTGKVIAVCSSEVTGVSKMPVACGILRVGYGLVGDSHAGLNPMRQVSLLAFESINRFNKKGYTFKPGDFAENITTEGLEIISLPVGTRLQIGNTVVLEITQIGKQCHLKCAIYQEIGKCIMPKEGIFASVIMEGEIGAGDRITVVEQSGELSVKRRQLRDLERKFAETQKLLTANSDFRNDLIWMSQDINKLKSEIGRLEKLAGKK